MSHPTLGTNTGRADRLQLGIQPYPRNLPAAGAEAECTAAPEVVEDNEAFREHI